MLPPLYINSNTNSFIVSMTTLAWIQVCFNEYLKMKFQIRNGLNLFFWKTKCSYILMEIKWTNIDNFESVILKVAQLNSHYTVIVLEL